MVTRSVVVLAVRPGNPRGLKDWDDLRAPGLNVLTPNVRTSGGAMWNVCALYGAALRGGTSAPKGDAAAAEKLLGEVLGNVSVMDKGARESILTFEKGVGDTAITYENEVLAARQAGYHVLVSSSHSDAAETRDVLRAMHGRVDGVIVMSPHEPPRALEGSLPPSLPAVFLNSAPGGTSRPSLSVDNRGGARSMTAHLLALGHRRVATVAMPLRLSGLS